MTERPIAVYIVEDDDALRDDFSRAIQACPQFRLTGSTGSAREARQYLEGRPTLDVLLVDLGLPDGDGTHLIRALHDHAPQAKALVITVFDDDRTVLKALSAGAKGYLLKDTTDDALAGAIHDVVQGDAPLSPQIARYLLRLFEEPVAQRPLASPDERLTPRKAEILTLVSRGYTGSEVAARLGLSQHTINTHLRNCHAKLEAKNRQQAIIRARDSGQIG